MPALMFGLGCLMRTAFMTWYPVAHLWRWAPVGFAIFGVGLAWLGAVMAREPIVEEDPLTPLAG